MWSVDAGMYTVYVHVCGSNHCDYHDTLFWSKQWENQQDERRLEEKEARTQYAKNSNAQVILQLPKTFNTVCKWWAS